MYGPWERARVLITVKAAPQPSAQYGDTVCVAGIRIDRQPLEWIRLYPIPFRYLEGAQQFAKYDVVTVDVRPADQDSRPESHKIKNGSVERVGSLKRWTERVRYMADLVVDDMCALYEAAKNGAPGPSLAVVRPRSVRQIKIRPHDGWTQSQRKALAAYAAQPDLMGNTPRNLLEPPRFEAHYRYTCAASRCRTHEQGILDWELVALQRNLARQSDQKVREAIEKNFFTNWFGDDTDSLLYVGNQAKRRHVFGILGVARPKRGDSAAVQSSLFV